MKRRALLRHLRKHGCILKREGARHSLWMNPLDSDANAARLAITAEVHWIWGNERSRTVFAVDTELLVQVGDYIVLAIAPSAGVANPALALVVRVDEG